MFTTNTWDFLYLLCSTDSEAYQYAYGTPMRQASGYSEVEIDPATTEDQPPMYDNSESSPQKADSANDRQLVSLYKILLLIVNSVKDTHGDILRPRTQPWFTRLVKQMASLLTVNCTRNIC